MDLSMKSDLIDPSERDWSKADDAALYFAAKAGIEQAIAEVERRATA